MLENVPPLLHCNSRLAIAYYTPQKIKTHQINKQKTKKELKKRIFRISCWDNRDPVLGILSSHRNIPLKMAFI